MYALKNETYALKKKIMLARTFCVVFDNFHFLISAPKFKSLRADVFRGAKNSNVLKGAFASAKAFHPKAFNPQ